MNKDGNDMLLEVKGKCKPPTDPKKPTENQLKVGLAFGGMGSDTVKSWTNVWLKSDLTALKSA